MATKADNKQQQLEAILDRKLGDEELQLIPLIESFAIHTITECTVVQRNIILATPNSCYGSRVMDISSYAVTGSNGQSVLRLTKFMCPSSDERFHGPINVVATPFSTKPFFVTVSHSLINNGADVEIKVFAWKPNGTPAANVTFHWRCRVERPIIIL
jgi:hypothetical protein